MLLPLRNPLQGSQCHLLPLESDEKLDDSVKTTQRERTSIDKSNVNGKHQSCEQPRIQTAKEVRDKICGQYFEND